MLIANKIIKTGNKTNKSLPCQTSFVTRINAFMMKTLRENVTSDENPWRGCSDIMNYSDMAVSHNQVSGKNDRGFGTWSQPFVEAAALDSSTDRAATSNP